MRTSLTDIRSAEQFLLGEMEPAETFVFEARQLTDTALAENVSLQRRLYDLLRFYHLRKLKAEAEAVHHRLFSDPGKKEFCEPLIQLFKK